MDTLLPELKRCAKCERKLNVAAFPFKRRAAKFKGEQIGTCEDCEAKRKDRNLQKKTMDNESQVDLGDNGVDLTGNDVTAQDCIDRHNLPPIALEEFLAILPESHKISANIDVSLLLCYGGGRSMADAIAKLVWKRTGYRFL
jgi:hypothetical protein